MIGSEGFGFAPYQGNGIELPSWVQSVLQMMSGSVQTVVLTEVHWMTQFWSKVSLLIILCKLPITSRLVKTLRSQPNAGLLAVPRLAKLYSRGACGVAGHLHITDNVTLTGMSMVTNNITEEGTYSSGMGLLPNQQWKRTVVRLRQLADVPLTQLVKRLDHMQSQIESIESTFKLRK